MRRYYAKLKQNPEAYADFRARKAAYQARKYKENPVRWVGENNKRRRATYCASNCVTRMLRNAKKRAAVKGWDFNITRDDIIVPDACPVFGTPFTAPAGHAYKSTAPSLDRIHNHLGYVKGNVVVVSSRANSLKSNATIEEMRKLVAFYETIEF